jgi:hypothetical protein
VESVARSVSGAINGYKVVVEKVRSRFTQRLGAQDYYATPQPDSSTSPRARNFSEKEPPSLTFLCDRIVVARTANAAAVLRGLRPMTDASYYQRKDAIAAGRARFLLRSLLPAPKAPSDQTPQRFLAMKFLLSYGRFHL